MPTTRPRLRLALVALLAVGTLVALGIARPEFGGAAWSRGIDVALIAAWVVACAASAWLLFATGICLVALGLDRPAVARRLAPALPAYVRKLVEVAIAGSCIAFPALPALPAHAAGPAPVPVVVRSDSGADRTGGAARATSVVADQPVVRAPAPAAPAAPAPPPVTAGGRVVVRPGDNLWLIARTALVSQKSGAAPTERDIARYWLTVISANRSTLRSGDPSLIFPGEIVTLPPTSAVS